MSAVTPNSSPDLGANRMVTLAGVLNVSPGWLLEGSDEFAPDPAGPEARQAALKAEIGEIKRGVSDLLGRLEALEGRLNT